jgi:5-amino-6-(5-phosphoribosylamino)uracil reductase
MANRTISKGLNCILSIQSSDFKDFSSVPQRPFTTVVLAMSADGKIADVGRSHPTFGSQHDFDHLEQQVALADAVLFGSTTLKAGGTAMRVINPERIAERVKSGKPEQPIQMVCTRTGDLDASLKFFQQPIPRYLLTTVEGAQRWQGQSGFDRVLATETQTHQINWNHTFAELYKDGIEMIAVLGGGEVVATLLEADLIDELHLTVCPILLGGQEAPTPVAGAGFLQAQAPHLKLISVKQVEGELFLHYRVLHQP